MWDVVAETCDIPAGRTVESETLGKKQVEVVGAGREEQEQ